MSLSIEKEIYLGKAAPGGGTPINNQDISVTENGVYSADSGYTGLGTVSVSVPNPSTGTKSITSNGTHNVADYEYADVNVPTTAPDYYILRDISGGMLKSNTVTSIINFNGITDIGSYALAYAYYNNTRLSGVDLDMSSITSLSQNYGLWNTFAGTSSTNGIKSVDLSGLQRIDGFCAMQNAFMWQTGLTSVDLSNLNAVYSDQAMVGAFQNTGLPELAMDNLITITNYTALSSICQDCRNLTKVSFKKLKTIGGGNAFGNAFWGCDKLSEFDMRSLETADNSVFVNTFRIQGRDTALATIKFQSLKSIKYDNVFQYMCWRSNMTGHTDALSNIYFYALDTNSFGGYTRQFDSMLYGCNNITVHFPMRIQSTIGSWSSVTGGFGGTNTTVLFDIVTTAVGADSVSYSRQEKDSTSTATAWVNNDTLYYTSGTTEPTVGATIYSDSACTTAVTTIDSIS